MKFFANMFEAWFKRKFDRKCKVNINFTLMRIEIIKRRRNAMQKFLRSDIAELMKIGCDSDAYKRVGRLYLDQNRLLCYDFVARYCTLVSHHLVAMNDQSECPEECKEAVSSLMYAAARFGDLPELRKLRTLFSERYGNSLESFVNKEFVDLLKPDCPTKDMKVRLMQEIAQEHGVEWDLESLDDRLYNPYSYQSDLPTCEDQNKEPRITENENSWMIKIQEMTNDDSKARKKDGSNDDLDKQTENLRQRILDYWSRATSFLSTSRETSTSSDESSTSSDDSTKSRRFFNSRLVPPPYDPDKKETNSGAIFDSPTNDVDKENVGVSNHPNVEKLDDEKTIQTLRTMKNRWWKKGGGTLPRVKLHPAKCLPNSTVADEPKGNARVTSYQPDLTMNPPTGHFHPKPPDYDELKARVAALTEKN